MPSSHPYAEPSPVAILVVAGFLLCLNLINKILDTALHCGLIGQIFIGVLFGTPGVKLLSNAFETSITSLGYLGLILLVYHGGLSTSLSSLISSSFVSILIAITGIILPIALSFLLLLLGASPLQCFAAGASLSATSLGTTLTVLTNGELFNTDVGIVLTSAAMLDDVVGLIMLQVVSEISGSDLSQIDYGNAIGRPVGASVGLVAVVVITARFIFLPLCRQAFTWAPSSKLNRIIKDLFETHSFTFLVHTAVLLILIVVSGYAGTSPLLASFVAGVMVRWLGEAIMSDEEVIVSDGSHPPFNGLEVYSRYYEPSTETILKPFFFASIGFSIPITQMFRGSVLWKGLVYALLMFIGKAATGIWLLIIPTPLKPFANCGARRRNVHSRPVSISRPSNARRSCTDDEDPSISTQINIEDQSLDAQSDTHVLSSEAEQPQFKVPRSYAPLLLGMAMVARGEIGFLIASVAASEGVFSPVKGVSEDNNELYLVIVWAIVVCTILGPVAVGGLTHRIKKMELIRQGR